MKDFWRRLRGNSDEAAKIKQTLAIQQAVMTIFIITPNCTQEEAMLLQSVNQCRDLEALNNLITKLYRLIIQALEAKGYSSDAIAAIFSKIEGVKQSRLSDDFQGQLQAFKQDLLMNHVDDAGATEQLFDIPL